MYIPKKYGQSKIDKCPFCQKTAIVKNSQDVPVCLAHKNDTIDELKCVCGETLDMLKGKYGVFFSCMKCGNMNLRKVLEFNTIKPRAEIKNPSPTFKSADNLRVKTSNEKKEITVRSDDPRYFD